MSNQKISQLLEGVAKEDREKCCPICGELTLYKYEEGKYRCTTCDCDGILAVCEKCGYPFLGNIEDTNCYVCRLNIAIKKHHHVIKWSNK